MTAFNPQLPDQNRQDPYVGLRAFRPNETDLFFGRDTETRILAGQVMARRASTFYAQSGAGKSSLLWAGLLPRLQGSAPGSSPRPETRAAKMTVLPIATVGNAVSLDVKGAIANIFAFSVLLNLLPDTPPEELTQLDLTTGLAGFFNPQPAIEPGVTRTRLIPALLILDQFEEIFTHHVERWADRQPFFEQLAAALATYPRLHILFTLREDYIAGLTPFSRLLPDELRSGFRTERLTERAALDAVQKPAAIAGRLFADDAAQELVQNLRRSAASIVKVSGQEEGFSEFIEPVQLQVVCQQLWNSLPPGQKSIGVEDVRRFGQVGEALTNYYESTVIEATRQSGVPQRAIRRWFDSALITRARTRSLVYRDAEESGGLANTAVDALADAYVIQPTRRGENTWYELAHDSLIEPVLQANRRWWATQSPILQAAQRWADAPDEEKSQYLLRGQLLQGARQTLGTEYEDDLVAEFVTESEQRALVADRERRRNLAEIGWGVIFAADADPALRAALQPLLTHRRRQAAARDPAAYQEYVGAKGYQAGESARTFLRRHRIDVNSSETGILPSPYYLLLVGSPEEIPFSVQYQLDVHFAVGRIAFETVHEYATYAQSVVQAETEPLTLAPNMTFFNVRNQGDRDTRLYDDRLVAPLVAYTSNHFSETWQIAWTGQSGYESTDTQSNQGSKSHLQGLFGGPNTPALLFTASHGAEIPAPPLRRRQEQGGLVCASWSGTAGTQATDPHHYFAAADLSDSAQILGLIAFLFADYSAGAPAGSDYAGLGAISGTSTLASVQPFVARLPQRLLSHPNGGALAVIGHVDRVQKHLIENLGTDTPPPVFAEMLSRLLAGHPVGSAMEPFNQRYLRTASDWASLGLTDALRAGLSDPDRSRMVAEEMDIRNETVDVRNYIVLGDPAVRLMITAPSQKPTHVPPPVSRSVLPPVFGGPSLFLHPDRVLYAQWREQDDAILTLCADGLLRLYTLDGRPPQIVASPATSSSKNEIRQAQWQPGGKLVATVDTDGAAAVRDGSTGALLHPLGAVRDQASLTAWSPDGTQIAVTSTLLSRGAYLIRVWQLSENVPQLILRGHTQVIRQCQWHPGGQQLLTVAGDGALFWEVAIESGQRTLTPSGRIGLCDGAAWSPDGQRLAVIINSIRWSSFEIEIRDTVTGDLQHKLSTHRTPVQYLHWSPDNALLVALTEGGTATAWDVESGQLRYQIGDHQLPVQDIDFLEPSSQLAAILGDGSLCLYEMEGGQLIKRLGRRPAGMKSLHVRPDGQAILTIGDDGVGLVWELNGEPVIHTDLT